MLGSCLICIVLAHLSNEKVLRVILLFVNLLQMLLSCKTFTYYTLYLPCSQLLLHSTCFAIFHLALLFYANVQFILMFSIWNTIKTPRHTKLLLFYYFYTVHEEREVFLNITMFCVQWKEKLIFSEVLGCVLALDLKVLQKCVQNWSVAKMFKS